MKERRPADQRDTTDVQCEGMRRYGGAFRLGPPQWVPCKNKATVKLKLKQNDEISEFAGCNTCWDECTKTKGIKVISVHPITHKSPDRKESK
jgi:hypothetical protein